MAHVSSKNINEMIRAGAIEMGLTNRGFPLSRLSLHSLRAGGAVALKLGGMDTIMLKKYERWSSDTFLTYIHEQISSLGHGVSKKMATLHNFYNVAGFED